MQWKAALCLCAALCLSPVAALGEWADGSYQDAGEGYHSTVVVTAIVREGKLQSVTAESRGDTPDEYLQTALDGLAPQLIENNGTQGVEAVSGATGSSRGILEAMDGVQQQAEASLAPVSSAPKIDAAAGSPAPSAQPTLDPAKAELFAGLGSVANFRVGPGKDETEVPVYSFNLAMASVLFDREGRIRHARVDAYEVSTPNYDGASMPHFSGWPQKEGYNVVDPSTGKVTGVSANTEQSLQSEIDGWVTKRERGDDYGMNPRNDWYQQMNAYEQWMIGKTPAELRGWYARYTSARNGRPIQVSSENEDDQKALAAMTEEDKQQLVEVTGMATMSLSDAHGKLLEAIEKAYENRVPVEP